jgi:hypothetical protein
MFKFEMQIGWLGNGIVKIETDNFDVIESLKDFIEFQESEGWVECYEFSTVDEDAEDELEDDLDETMSGQAVQ